MVALARQRALGVRRARLHAAPRRLDQRREDRRVGAALPLGQVLVDAAAHEDAAVEEAERPVEALGRRVVRAGVELHAAAAPFAGAVDGGGDELTAQA